MDALTGTGPDIPMPQLTRPDTLTRQGMHMPRRRVIGAGMADANGMRSMKSTSIGDMVTTGIRLLLAGAGGIRRLPIS